MLSLVDSQSHSSSTLLTVCCTTRCCQTSDPLRQNRRRRHRTRRQTNLRLGYAPKSSFRSSWRLFTGHRQGKCFLFLSCFYQNYFDFNIECNFPWLWENFARGVNLLLICLTWQKRLTQQAGWWSACQAKHRRLVLICLFYNIKLCSSIRIHLNKGF